TQGHATRQFVELHASQVQSCALAGKRLLGLAAVHLHAANAGPLARRKNLNLLLLPDLAGDQRAGHHRAEALHGEHAVDGQAEEGFAAARRDIRGETNDLALQVVKTGPLEGADCNHRRARSIEKRPAHKILNLQANDVERVFIHQVGLGDYGDAARDGKEAADLKMLARLRLDGFVGGDHQQHHVDAAHAGQHVADKTLMAGDVDETQTDFFTAGSCELKMGEAEVDGDTAAFFLFQAVGIDAGESLDQGSLAMVDVSG